MRGCFYCLKTFDASEVARWVRDNSTTFCPRCGIDAVLSSRTHLIDPVFLHRMHSRWFGQTVRVDLSDRINEAAKVCLSTGRPEHMSLMVVRKEIIRGEVVKPMLWYSAQELPPAN